MRAGAGPRVVWPRALTSRLFHGSRVPPVGILAVTQRQAAEPRPELVVLVPQPFQVAAPQSVPVVARLQVSAPALRFVMKAVALVAASRPPLAQREMADA
jgi:hypothetical protein